MSSAATDSHAWAVVALLRGRGPSWMIVTDHDGRDRERLVAPIELDRAREVGGQLVLRFRVTTCKVGVAQFVRRQLEPIVGDRRGRLRIGAPARRSDVGSDTPHRLVVTKVAKPGYTTVDGDLVDPTLTFQALVAPLDVPAEHVTARPVGTRP
jgi:hypothetical protein